MEVLIGALTDIRNIKFTRDDDFVDRLNHEVSGAILIAMAMLVTMRSYTNDPIACWVPGTFNDEHRKYANTICWVSNTYRLPWSKQIPENHQTRRDLEIVYYQWAAFILVLQAFIFYLPCMYWRNMNRQSEININKILDLTRDGEILNKDSRKKMLKSITEYIDYCLQRQKQYTKLQTGWRKFANCMFGGRLLSRKYGNYLTSHYFIAKVCYIALAIGQLFMLKHFIGTESVFYGPSMLFSVYQTGEWNNSHNFPRVTMCDFEIKVIGNLHRHTVQCTLSVNMFNDKIFLFVWFWIVCVTLVTIYSLYMWSLRMTPCQGRQYIRKHLIVLDADYDERQLAKFVAKYLRKDGLLLLRLIGANSNEVLISELIDNLWGHFKRSEQNDDMQSTFREATLRGMANLVMASPVMQTIGQPSTSARSIPSKNQPTASPYTNSKQTLIVQ